MLAGKWKRPSILLAVHKTKHGQDKAEKALEERLLQQGQDVVHLMVDQEHTDIPHQLERTAGPEEHVFFVSNLDWGAGEDRKDAYRALNIYREIFVDHKLRVVLWLTINEAATLARLAPDFWAFRHRVIEFTGQRIPRKVSLPAGALLWDVQNLVDPFDTLDARIAVREELLAKLPDDMEARSARVDLLYNLGHLHWLTGDASKASTALTSALELAADQTMAVRSPLLNGLAIIAYEANDHAMAVDLLQQATQHHSDDPLLLANLAIALNAVGRNSDAVTHMKQAVKLSPRDPRAWNAAGYLYAAIGKFDDAIAAFVQAADLAPRVAAYQVALAICYTSVEQSEDANRCLALARDTARENQRIGIEIYEAAIRADLPKALQLARNAIRSEQLSVHEIRRDPGLSLLLDAPQLEELTP